MARAARTAAFTFVEILLATLVVGGMLLAASQAMGAAALSHQARLSGPLTALDLAQEVHAATMLLDRGPGLGRPASNPAEVTALLDLHGAAFRPAVDASLTPIPDAGRFTQEIALQRVLLSDPAVAASAPDRTDALYTLTVTIREDGAVAGTYTWWISP